MEEVAAILSTSTAAVKVRVHDARRQIERRIERNPGLADGLMRGAE
jgi:DNA-directed RNA polymerase specialized sigma24 family protein